MLSPKNTTAEEWRKVFKYPNYSISNLGRLRHDPSSRIRKLRTGQDGRLETTMYYKGKYSTVKIHRLVAEAWIPAIKNKLEVNHKDGCRQNNKTDNLEWCSHLENMQHASKLGLVAKGKTHPSYTRPGYLPKGSANSSAKLTEKDIPVIRKLVRQGTSRKEIAFKFKVCTQTIDGIIHKITWKHVQ